MYLINHLNNLFYRMLVKILVVHEKQKKVCFYLNNFCFVLNKFYEILNIFWLEILWRYMCHKRFLLYSGFLILYLF